MQEEQDRVQAAFGHAARSKQECGIAGSRFVLGILLR